MNKSKMKTFLFFMKDASKEKPLYPILFILQTLITGLFPFVNLYLTKYLLEAFTENAGIKKLALLGTLLVVFNFLFKGLMIVLEGNISKISMYLSDYYRVRLSQKAALVPYSCAEDSEMIEKSRKARGAFFYYAGGIEGLMRNITPIFSGLITVMGVITIVAVNTPILLLVAILAVIGSAITVWQTNRVKKIEVEEYPKMDRAMEYVFQVLRKNGIAKSVRLYDASEMLATEVSEATTSFSKVFRRVGNITANWNCVGNFVNFLKNLAIYGYLAYKLLTGMITIGDFSLLAGSANTLKDSLQDIITKIQELGKELSFLGEAAEYLSMEEVSHLGSKELENDKTPEIEFKNVSFKYPGTENYVLKDINIKIHPGEHLSIVGLNGAGKTTFIKLLCRFYDVTEGRILLNGTDIKEYKYEDYMKELEVVFQDFKMFSQTIRDNIVNGDWENPDKDLDSIIKMSDLKSLVDKLPKGVDTMMDKQLDKEGFEPSGGELQKLAIARALYRDAPVVILDEPTAALDPIAEYEVYRKFNELVGGKSAIYISHRLSSCQFCDKIAVFAEKTIKEYGTHAELVHKEGGIYSKMFAAQAKYYA